MSRTRNVRTILAVAASTALLPMSSAWSQQPAPTIQDFLMQRLQPGTQMEPYLEAVRTEFFTADADSDGEITQRDIDLHTLMEGVRARTDVIQSVMRYDLDGDGSVTEDEIRTAMKYDMRAQFSLTNSKQQPSAADAAAKRIDFMVRSIMVLDTDKDGKVSLAEGVKLGGSNPGRGMNGYAPRARQLLAAAGAANGALTLTAYVAMGEALFRQIDTDKDGTISQQELTDYRTRAERAGCEMPLASEKAKVVLLSSYETEALSSVTLGSQDSVVHAGNVVIEPGSEPVYVVIVSYAPTVWRFSGAVERVERVMMGSALSGPNSSANDQRSLVGATGIAAEKITFFGKPNCMNYFNETPSSASLQAVAAVRSSTGKAPETVATKYAVTTFKVPSGGIETVRGEPGRPPLIIEKGQGTLKVIGNAAGIVIQAGPSRAKDDMYRFSPGGVIEIDPKTVVSSVAATNYEVLPQQAGLVQLLASGAVKQNSAGEYIVREKIRFPAGLNGGHSVTFLVMNGTPYPDGDPGHSCVIVEATGQKKGPACR